MPAHLALTDTDIQNLQTNGYTAVPNILTPRACRRIEALWDHEGPAEAPHFYSYTDMGKKGYGSGTYKYFTDAGLPHHIDRLRTALYLQTVNLANEWQVQRQRPRFPSTWTAYRDLCATKYGLEGPSCLLLRYERGDYNDMHQDNYGMDEADAFPFQLVVMLSPSNAYAGGSLKLTFDDG